MNDIIISFWCIIFAVISYMMIADERFKEFFNLFFMGVWIQLRKYYWMARLHPKNPITNFIMERKMKAMAKELAKTYNLPEE